MTNEPEPVGDLAAAQIENLKNNQVDNKPKHGGPRPGAGRKKGGKNAEVKAREEQLRQFRDRVGKHVDRLFNAQANLATGEQYLFVKITTGSGKERKTHTEIVTDPETIKQYLDGDLNNSDDEYYYLSTKPANNMAIDSLLNRAFGTPQKNVDLTSKGQSVLGNTDDAELRRIAAATSEALADDTES